MSSTNNEKDPLLDELEERIAEGPVMFTPDEEFLRRVAEKRKEINEKEEKQVKKWVSVTVGFLSTGAGMSQNFDYNGCIITKT